MNLSLRTILASAALVAAVVFAGTTYRAIQQRAVVSFQLHTADSTLKVQQQTITNLQILKAKADAEYAKAKVDLAKKAVVYKTAHDTVFASLPALEASVAAGDSPVEAITEPLKALIAKGDELIRAQQGTIRLAEVKIAVRDSVIGAQALVIDTQAGAIKLLKQARGGFWRRAGHTLKNVAVVSTVALISYKIGKGQTPLPAKVATVEIVQR